MQNLEGKVLELEDKVIDLESDNKGLKDDKDKLVVEKEGLLGQISVSISIERITKELLFYLMKIKFKQ